jgi:hypothetical protein
MAVLTAWLLAALLALSVALAGEVVAPPRTGFDRAGLEKELSRPLSELRQQGPEALRSHARRLSELYSSLEVTGEISSAEQRSLGDQIVARVAQVGLLTREAGASATGETKAREGTMTARGVLEGAVGFLSANSLVAIGLLGGLIIAYSVGRLGGYRRGASEASYYGAGDPRLWFVTHARDGVRAARPGVRVSLDQIRSTLASGHAVLLQLGYAIAPSRREEFLGLIREMHLALNGLDDQVYSAWEDPRHPNRFYEVVLCRRLEVLDLLTSESSELAGLDARIESCWLPGQPIALRAWWGVFPERGAEVSRLVARASSGGSREDRVA